jgi:hypothetical protein
LDGDVIGHQVLLDYAHVAIDDQAAVEAAEQLQIQRRRDHRHAARRPARHRGQADPGLAQLPGRSDRRRHHRLVMVDERAVDIGDDERNPLRGASQVPSLFAHAALSETAAEP